MSTALGNIIFLQFDFLQIKKYSHITFRMFANLVLFDTKFLYAKFEFYFILLTKIAFKKVI